MPAWRLMGPTPTELAFVALEDTLSTTAVRHMRKLKPFSIGVLDRAEMWTFDPARASLFERTPVANPALRLFLSEATLCQVAFGTGEPLGRDDVKYLGDLEVLKTFVGALAEAKSPLTVRLKDQP